MHVKKRKDSSSDDEVPLQTVRKKMDDLDPNAYDALILPSEEPCEFCDKVCNNRYTSIIHNVHHIIIPLLNQTVTQCEICLHHFTSSTDLVRHQSKKHTLSEILSQTDLVRTSFNKPTEGTYESDLITIIKKDSPKIKLKNMENMISVKPMVKIEEFITENPIVKVENLILKDEEKFTSDDDCGFDLDVGELSDYGGPSLKSRLVFEDDIINLGVGKVLNGLTDCEVKTDLFPTLSAETKSVHYNELVKPGLFGCKKCSKTFPSRYEVIIHESQHLIIKNSQVTLCKTCNGYILGDFNDLKYHYMKIHSIEAAQIKKDAKKYFGGKIEENGFVYQPLSKKIVTLKLCEVCFSFCKNKASHNYYCIGELNELGKRYRCEKCGLKFYAIKLIRRETRYRQASFKKSKYTNNKVISKGMSNEARLKIISQRFKMMKRKYFVCFI